MRREVRRLKAAESGTVTQTAVTSAWLEAAAANSYGLPLDRGFGPNRAGWTASRMTSKLGQGRPFRGGRRPRCAPSSDPRHHHPSKGLVSLVCGGTIRTMAREPLTSGLGTADSLLGSRCAPTSHPAIRASGRGTISPGSDHPVRLACLRHAEFGQRRGHSRRRDDKQPAWTCRSDSFGHRRSVSDGLDRANAAESGLAIGRAGIVSHRDRDQGQGPV